MLFSFVGDIEHTFGNTNCFYQLPPEQQSCAESDTEQPTAIPWWKSARFNFYRVRQASDSVLLNCRAMCIAARLASWSAGTTGPSSLTPSTSQTLQQTSRRSMYALTSSLPTLCMLSCNVEPTVNQK